MCCRAFRYRDVIPLACSTDPETSWSSQAIRIPSPGSNPSSNRAESSMHPQLHHRTSYLYYVQPLSGTRCTDLERSSGNMNGGRGWRLQRAESTPSIQSCSQGARPCVPRTKFEKSNEKHRFPSKTCQRLLSSRCLYQDVSWLTSFLHGNLAHSLPLSNRPHN